MQKRRLGRTGLMVSPIARGGVAFGYAQKSAGWDGRTEDGRRGAIATIHAALRRPASAPNERRRTAFMKGSPR